MEMDESNVDPIHDIIDFLVRVEGVSFKSQQKDDTDLTVVQKKELSFEVFKKGKLCFLERFGKHLKLEHLAYFESQEEINSQSCYEINFHLNELKKLLSDRGRRCAVKNRRYEALQKMIKDTTYFSEVEMMQRNPLLYEHLIGQYMSDKEKKARDNIDTENITLLNVLLEGISKNHRKTILKEQEEKEDEENCVSGEEANVENNDEAPVKASWGEFTETAEKKMPKRRPKEQQPSVTFITAPERNLLREEFFQEMYRSFIDGEDEDFDYKTVDDNSEYDCLRVREKDEEEKYFDTESPEDLPEPTSEANVDDVKQNESEDELDVFMNHINKHPSVVDTVQINK